MQFRVALALAFKETRRARGGLLFCTFSVALGVASLTTIQAINASLKAGLVDEGRQLLGADLVVNGSAPLEQSVVADVTNAVLQAGGRTADVVSFNSMLRRATPGGGKQTALVRVRAVSSEYPLHGRLDTQPPGGMATLAASGGVLVDPATARDLGLSVGERVKLGALETRVVGTFVKQPGSVAAGFSLAPLLFLDARQLAETKLLQTGSRIEYQRLFALPDGNAASSLKERFWDAALDARLELQTFEEATAGTQRFFSQVGRFLTIVGLVVLMLGALGIGAALQALMRQKLQNAAILRCLGASPGGVLGVYASLAALLAGLGSLLGALVGAGAPYLLQTTLQRFAAGFLPTELSLATSPRALLTGALAGVAATFAFTLLPLLKVARVAPLRVLRGDAELAQEGSALSRTTVAVAGVCAIAVGLAISVSELRSLATGAAFCGAVLAALAGLAALAWGTMAGARWIAARLTGPRGYVLRQGLSNLQRPDNRTVAVLVAVGLSVMLLAATNLFASSIRGAVDVENRQDLPNLFVVDVLPDQAAAVREMLQAQAAHGVHLEPMISGRLRSLNGQPIEVRNVERNAGKRTWQDRLRTREYFFSYRSELADNEEVVAGALWQGRPQAQEASLDEELAQTLGVHLGDVLTLDVQGLPLDARVTSLRRIRWQTMQPNVLVLLSPGEIEKAPAMYIGSVRVPAAEARYDVQSQLVKRFENLSVIDIDEAAQTVFDVLARLRLLFDFVGAVALGTGALIVGGAIVAGRHARQRELALLKVLGASPRQLSQILGVEYAALAGLGSLAGWLLAEVMARVLLPLMFDVPPRADYRVISGIVLGSIALNLLVAFWSGRSVARAPSLETLRAE